MQPVGADFLEPTQNSEQVSEVFVVAYMHKSLAHRLWRVAIRQTCQYQSLAAREGLTNTKLSPVDIGQSVTAGVVEKNYKSLELQRQRNQ